MANIEIREILREKDTTTSGQIILGTDVIEGQESIGGADSSFKSTISNLSKHVQETPYTGELQVNNQIVTMAELKDYSETISIANISTNILTVTVSAGNVVLLSLTENITSSIFNVVSDSNIAKGFVLIITQDSIGGRTISWPNSVKWANGISPALTVLANSVSILSFETIDGGISWFGSLLGDNFI